ncbi:MULTISPECIES: cytochrome c oxidase assembly protein [Marinobacter]|jgi:cytochrome c oxidase assembly protein subunit 11|uniref:Cytochrome c oxidase assembly protein CtaG n=2 Tax=Marinobacter TaxID=2742 RepID=A0A844I5U7_9GAMM|nr:MULTISPECIES: cytochrome c oxidase assembly protein [Marinobacter]MTI99337.1 cytochrome c oxidase assembly protein [Marinobacter adhaerens]MBO6809966.1 cytochrome c oxidase assembly protein [Marinobacter sp.]MBO6872198.1 cytochrome c oxidase assembly protein [Marinobacter sp.]MBY6072125.1 cytochrome c oxidase assembly protein [Marinobacter salsuginis]QTN42501.1 cytochrome c oxidase assembly protein [Marinobacter salsuginis]|tara:strand:+ start:249 stop:851 length:603 start_codon:yes stop_codon:yes gene_type:complete
MSNQQANNAGSSRSTNRVVGWCLAGVVGMFAFGFAMVPLYDVFCEITGINGKTGGRYESTEVAEADMTRTVKVQFLASNGPGMTWKFRPVVRSVEVHPGEPTTVNFYAENPTTEAMVGQAVPSLAPSEGTLYFHKTECFCFNQQPLEAGESTEMPLIFIVDKDLPEHITKLTLSYTLYDQGKQPAVTQTSRKDTTTNDNG